MTQTEITLKLRDDCILIMDAAQKATEAERKEWWPEAARKLKKKTWKEKRATMTKIMGDKDACRELIENIQEIEDAGVTGEMLSESFFSSTIKLLSYRLEANNLSVPAEKTKPGWDWSEKLDAAAKALTKYNQTIIGYRMVQELGDGDARTVVKMIRQKLGPESCTRDIGVTKTPFSGADLREKTAYMGHNVWIVEPSLPVYIITMDTKHPENA